MPALPGYDMHGTCLPAQQTGGDTCDLALSERGLLVVLGDAAGHGIAPALVQVVFVDAALDQIILIANTEVDALDALDALAGG